jgi:hypothetical protein
MGRLIDVAVRASTQPVKWRKLLSPGIDVESFQRFNAEAQARREADKRAREDELSALRASERPVCEIHDWGYPEPGKPPPLRSECPGCKPQLATGEGLRVERDALGYPVESDPDIGRHSPEQWTFADKLWSERKGDDPEPPRGTPAWRLWWGREQQRRTGAYDLETIEALRERQALDRIDELREKELKSQQRRSNVTQLFPYDGSRYIVRRRPRRQRLEIGGV